MLIYRFHTKNFTVECEQLPEYDPDLSWDEDGSVAKQIQSGEVDLFTAHVCLKHRDTGLSVSEYLGDCVYAPGEFTHPLKGYYFRDMVRSCIADMRERVRKIKSLNI